jgi:hypothetical protein
MSPNMVVRDNTSSPIAFAFDAWSRLRPPFTFHLASPAAQTCRLFGLTDRVTKPLLRCRELGHIATSSFWRTNPEALGA